MPPPCPITSRYAVATFVRGHAYTHMHILIFQPYPTHHQFRPHRAVHVLKRRGLLQKRRERGSEGGSPLAG